VGHIREVTRAKRDESFRLTPGAKEGKKRASESPRVAKAQAASILLGEEGGEGRVVHKAVAKSPEGKTREKGKKLSEGPRNNPASGPDRNGPRMK